MTLVTRKTMATTQGMPSQPRSTGLGNDIWQQHEGEPQANKGDMGAEFTSSEW